VPASDHHSEYLARTVAALTPEGRGRVDELLDQLLEAAGNRLELVQFAKVLKAEADTGEIDVESVDEAGRTPSEQELQALASGFIQIRDQEYLDDVADWANAVLALLEDEIRSAG
jgi:hypothetical protein